MRTHTIAIAAAVPTPRLPMLPQALPELSNPPPPQQTHPRDRSLKLDQQSSQLRIGESTEVECYSSDSSYTDVAWERADGSPLPPNIQVSCRLSTLLFILNGAGDFSKSAIGSSSRMSPLPMLVTIAASARQMRASCTPPATRLVSRSGRTSGNVRSWYMLMSAHLPS